MQTPSADTRKWGKNQFSVLFPSLQEAPIHPTPPATDISELLPWIIPLQAGIQPPRQTDGEGNQSEDTPAASDHLGISTPELKALLQMCGKPPGVTLNSLPTWSNKFGKKVYQSNTK